MTDLLVALAAYIAVQLTFLSGPTDCTGDRLLWGAAATAWPLLWIVAVLVLAR